MSTREPRGKKPLIVASNASAVEIVWLLIAVTSLGLTVLVIRDNWINLAAIRDAVRKGRAIKWGPRYWVAFASLVSSAAMFAVWLGFASVGVLSMTVSPDDPIEYRAVVSWGTGWLLVAMTLILAGIQVWQVFARTKIRPLTDPEGDIDAAADQTKLAADMVDALRPGQEGNSHEPSAKADGL